MKSLMNITDVMIKYIPLLGIITFALLFYFASLHYPGGHQENLNATGYNWIHNYICNLTRPLAMNEVPNPGRPYAVAALNILCLSLIAFFYRVGAILGRTLKSKRLIQISGFLTMFAATFIFTEAHDMMILVSTVFGLILIISMVREIHHSAFQGHKWFGLLCFILLVLCNISNYGLIGIYYLPMLQKITLVICLGWILSLNFRLEPSQDT